MLNKASRLKSVPAVPRACCRFGKVLVGVLQLELGGNCLYSLSKVIMAGQPTSELASILASLSPFVSTKSYKRALPPRSSTPRRKSSGPPRPSTPQLQEAAHPFTNMKICMLIDLHKAMEEPETPVHLPRLSEGRGEPTPSKQSV